MSVISLRTQIREDHLTCAICFNNFIKPKALPCLHTYCEECLRDYVVSRGYEGTGCFPCPTCRANTTMPESGVEGFPDNHLMSSLSDTVESRVKPPSRPVPKPRRSLGTIGQPKPQENTDDQALPPPYSSVADTNPEAAWGGSGAEADTDMTCSKVCANDSEPDWMVVARQPPSAPTPSNTDHSHGVTEFCVVSVAHPGTTPNPPLPSSLPSQDIHPNVDQTPFSSGHARLPSQPPAYPYPGGALPGLPSYPDLAGFSAPTNTDTSQPSAPIGWNLNALDSMHASMGPTQGTDQRNDGHNISTHSPRENATGGGHNRPARSLSPMLYPTVPSHVDNSNTACSENLMLKFGKQGSSVRDFLKPVGLAVSKDGSYIISDNGGDQNRIFIYNSGGELTAAFKCGCKVKDVTVTKKNEIFAAVHKNVAAIRHFTMAGQCKGEYGKFFTYEEPCGIAELKNGGAVLTGTQNHCVYVLTDQMKLGTKFGRKGNGDGYFQHPGYIAVDSKNHIIVTDKVNNSVQIFGSDGKFKHRFGKTGTSHGGLQAPLGVCVDDDDSIIVADSGNFRVEVFSSKGRWLSSVVTKTNELGENVKPVNVAFTPTGKVAVLLRGPYFAEVRIYSSRHRQIAQSEGPVSNSAVWYSK